MKNFLQNLYNRFNYSLLISILIFLLLDEFFCSDLPELFKYIYPKLKYLSDGKSANFCNNYECTYYYNVSEKLKKIFNYQNEKYFCMINNSLYLLKNENEFIYIKSNFSLNLESILRYNLIPYSIEDNLINYIIIYIENKTKIILYQYNIDISNIKHTIYLDAKLIKIIDIEITNLSMDINCQIINSLEGKKLICFYLISSIQIRLNVIIFDFENNLNYMQKGFNLSDTSLTSSQKNAIKSSILNEEELFIGFISNLNVFSILYNYKNNYIINKFYDKKVENNMSKNEVETFYFCDSREVFFCFNNNSASFKVFFIKKNNSNLYEKHDYNDYFYNNEYEDNNIFYYYIRYNRINDTYHYNLMSEHVFR